MPGRGRRMRVLGVVSRNTPSSIETRRHQHERSSSSSTGRPNQVPRAVRVILSNGNYAMLVRSPRVVGSGVRERARWSRVRRAGHLELNPTVEYCEDRVLLSTSPIRIGTLGDSLTDEYQFYP